ncbi:DUF551 domain-containing protein [Citrobacter freundii]|uniref:DUF551 domain-containing protein n=1 Tax=Citrobacter freundii TaxID=546 RepID=UPI003D7BFC04
MTTNNHPAHGPVSLKRLHQISEILSKAAAQSDGGNLGYAMADAVKVIDGTIAAFGAEPVEFLPDNLDRALTILGVALPISKEEFNLDAERWMQRLINRVIRLESELIPPAPAAPEWTSEQCLEFLSIAFRHAEIKGDLELDDIRLGIKMVNESRAAMLQAGNSPVTPDGWIPVSERMPEASGRYWCYVEEQNSLGKSHYQWNCSWNGERWWVESDNGGRVTHWMELPAAPQQEE